MAEHCSLELVISRAAPPQGGKECVASVLDAIAPAEAHRDEDNDSNDYQYQYDDAPPLFVLPVHLLSQLHACLLKLVSVVPQLISLDHQIIELFAPVQDLHSHACDT